MGAEAATELDLALRALADGNRRAILRAIGIPLNMYTVMFAMGRMPGWISHWKELHDNPGQRIYRPRQLYVGNQITEWVPRHAR